MRVSALVRRARRWHASVTVPSRRCSNVSKEDAKAQGQEGGSEGVVVGAVQSESGEWQLSAGGAALDATAGGALSRQMNELQCALKPGQAFAVSVGERAGALACVGRADGGYDALEALHTAREAVRAAVGAGVMLLAARGVRRLQVDPCAPRAEDAAAEAAALAAWSFQEFKACEDRKVEPAVALLDGAGDDQLWSKGHTLAQAQNWARWLADMPANKMTPIDLAQTALDVLCPMGVKVEVRDLAWLQAQSMRCILAVARGSCEPPVMLELSYDGPGASTRPVLLCAKGVTFDSGGLCLKRPEDMVENRGSMAGAAVVLAAFKALAELKAPVKLRAAIPLCENMVSGQCMKVGDVVTALNGLSIQVEHTDMEGRLLLADALVHGQALHRPALVLTVATLTRGVALATGGGAFGAFSTHEDAWTALQQAGAHTGDRGWRFPLWHYYQRQVTNEQCVDLRNKGSGHASSCLGAAFLKNFVCGPWSHWDITGVGKLARCPAPPYLDARRMTGRPTRTLASFLLAVTQQQQHQPQEGDCSQ